MTPGWNDNARKLREDALSWHHFWNINSRPKDGHIAEMHRICDLITRREYKRELRTNDQMNLVVPFVKRKHFGERSFSYAAPREWNKLELSIRKSESLESFKKKLKPIFLKLHINKTCIDFGLLLSRIYIIMVSYCILYRVNYISIYTYVILLIIYVLSYTCISVIVIVLCYLYLRYFMHRLNFILYMYFCDIICICFYVQSVEHFVDIGL